MKNIKRKIVSVLSLYVIVITILLTVTFNIFINQYIYSEVKKSIDVCDTIAFFEATDFNSILAQQDTLFTATNLSIEYEYIGTDAIILECLENKTQLLNGEIICIRMNNLTYYVKCIYRTEKDFMVAIVNVSSVLNMAKTINIIFVLILLIAGIAFSVIGLRFGSKIENTQSKLKTFFANTTHELKTPLMSIQGYAEAIQENIIDNKTASSVILQKSDDMNILINRILELSKLDSGEEKRGFEEVDLNEVLYQCLEDIQTKDIHIAINFENTTHFIRGGQSQLYQLFSNIITNARRYVESTIEISIKENSHSYSITIYNDGEQIEEKHLSHILERFYKGEKGKTGIGLSIANEITKLYDGNLAIKNVENGVKVDVILKK